MVMHERNIQPQMPDGIQTEQALLGSLLVNNSNYWQVAGFLKPHHFSEQLHQELFDTMGKLIAENRPATPANMLPYLPTKNINKDMSVTQYVARLATEAVTFGGAYDYGRGILELWTRRQIVAVAGEIAQRATCLPVDVSPMKLIAAFADELTSISREGDERAGAAKYGVLLPKALERVAKESMGTRASIPWFLPEITAVCGDLRHGNLVGFMSDSGGGKTSFSLQQCRHAALKGFKSAFFSIEITDEEAALQAAAQASRISLDRIDSYSMDTRELQRIESEMMNSRNMEFDIVSFSDCTLSDIRIKAEAIKKSKGLDLIVIDHAKMINLPGKPGELFAERVNALYRGLKAIAKSLDIAIVILIQRNEEWKGRWKVGGSIRPINGDAYGGGSVKQNLDVWFSLFRPEPLYKELMSVETRENKRDELIQKYEKSVGKGWLINHKRRRGTPGQSREIIFEAEYTMFSSPERHDQAELAGFLS